MSRPPGTHPRRRSAAAPAPAAAAGLGPGYAAYLFVAAFAARLLFWQATPDLAWPHSAFYKGDAPLWFEYAAALQKGEPFELGLPLHPPGAGYLVSFLWDGTLRGVARVKLAWCAMGAAAVALSAAAIARAFGASAGRIGGALLVGWTPWLVLSTSVNVETPYLLPALAILWLWPEPTASRGRLAGWGALHAVSCLFRVEHTLFAGAGLVLVAVRSVRAGVALGRTAGGTALAFGAFLLVLAPWQAKAWSAVRRFNTAPPPLEGTHPVRRMAQQFAGVPWEAEAARQRDGLPAFAREAAAVFVTATVVHRGGTTVRSGDVAVLEEAFGDRPRPLAPWPFVSSYGPLNFSLSWHPQAGTGFSPAALEAPPPLAGGTDRYPPALVAGLPPPQLAFTYPPHVALFTGGYAAGLRWIRDDPNGALRRAGARLARFWTGATAGLGGYGLPGGFDLRPAVDMAVPRGPLAAAWSVLVLLVAGAGAVFVRHAPAAWPWMLLLASKAATAVAFFGYARLGAVSSVVVVAMVAVAFERMVGVRRPGFPYRRVALVGAALLVALEATRAASPPALVLDGRVVGARDPFPADDHRDRKVEVR